MSDRIISQRITKKFRWNFPKVVDQPRALPEFRALLADMCGTEDGLIPGVEYQKMLVELTTTFPDAFSNTDEGFVLDTKDTELRDEISRRVFIAKEQSDHAAVWYRQSLNDAQLIYVDAPMMDVVTSAAEAAPDDLLLHEYDAPSPSGLVVFATPVFGTDAGSENPGGDIQVNAILWGPVRLPAKDVPWWDERSGELLHEGVSIASFRLILPEDTDLMGTTFNVSSPFWYPLGRSDWLWGERLDCTPSEFLPNHTEAQFESMKEDRRLLAALWATLNQRRLVDAVDVPPDRYVTKRLARAKYPKRNETVRIVHLRRAAYLRTDQIEEGSGRRVTVRFPVKAHYKRQPFGKNRSERKLILVAQHWRGPDDAPVTHVENVWRLDR